MTILPPKFLIKEINPGNEVFTVPKSLIFIFTPVTSARIAEDMGEHSERGMWSNTGMNGVLASTNVHF